MNKRYLFVLLALILIVIVGAGGYYYITTANAAKLSLSDSDYAVVKRGTLVATVNATGSLEPNQQAALAFLAVGNVADLNVKLGDQIQAGQLLARLDTRELELQVAQAEANLASAQAKYSQLLKGPGVEDAASAQQNLASAQAAYDKLVNPDSNDVLALKSDIDKSKAVLAQAQAAYDRAGGDANPFIAQTPQSLQLQSATLDYQKALALYNSKLNPSNAQIQQALATIQSAKSQIARLQPVAEDLSAAKASVQAAQAARDLATERLNEAKIIAPFNATVIKIDLEKGGFVSAGRPVITVADLHKLRVTINIDETDIPRVQVGLPVDLDFDAFPNVKLTGHVTELAPSATIVQGVVNYGVKVTLDPSDTPIRLGMTVNANIQVAKKENVLLVPNRAIRATNNRRVVSIYDGVALHDSELKLGLSNDQETEVISGLEEGQRVVVTALPATIPGFGR